jgi:hypothetical protein
MDKPTFDWLIRAGDVDVRLLMIAFRRGAPPWLSDAPAPAFDYHTRTARWAFARIILMKSIVLHPRGRYLGRVLFGGSAWAQSARAIAHASKVSSTLSRRARETRSERGAACNKRALHRERSASRDRRRSGAA